MLVICDNSTTAMTGGQPHAGSGKTVTQQQTKPLYLEMLIKGCGVEFIEVTDPYNISKTRKAFKRALAYEGVSVVISRRGCALQTAREALRLGKKLPSYVVDQEKCAECWQCVKHLACPAIIRDGDKIVIDSSQCVGCGICAQVCHMDAIISQTNSKLSKL